MYNIDLTPIIVKKMVCNFHELHYDTYMKYDCRYTVEKVNCENGSYEIVACQICGNTKRVKSSKFIYWEGYKAYTCSHKCSGVLNNKRAIVRAISILVLMKWYTREQLCKMFNRSNDTLANIISFAYKYRANNKYVVPQIEYIIRHVEDHIRKTTLLIHH